MGEMAKYNFSRLGISERESSAISLSDLAPLADALSDIANKLRSGRILTETSSAFRSETEQGGSPHAPLSNQPCTVLVQNNGVSDELAARDEYSKLARILYANRRKRGSIFGSDELFGEPAWDILLDLYIADFESKPVSVSSACIGSASPSTTGLRWLGILADQNLVERHHDPHDQRRVLVRLSKKGLAAMDRYFEQMIRSHQPAKQAFPA